MIVPEFFGNVSKFSEGLVSFRRLLDFQEGKKELLV